MEGREFERFIPTQGSDSLCSEQHFCSCPPFLKYSSRQDGDQLHFTKHNYEEQYAILGKSKELHCCVGPGYQTLEWFKDGAMFPWDTDQGTSRNSILYRLKLTACLFWC